MAKLSTTDGADIGVTWERREQGWERSDMSCALQIAPDPDPVCREERCATSADPCPVCDAALPPPRRSAHQNLQVCRCGYARGTVDGDPKNYDGYESRALFNGMTPAQCLKSYTQQQQQDGQLFRPLTERQRRMAQLMWRGELHVKVAATKAADAEREARRVLVDLEDE